MPIYSVAKEFDPCDLSGGDMFWRFTALKKARLKQSATRLSLGPVTSAIGDGRICHS
jgi:hypothetical protein